MKHKLLKQVSSALLAFVMVIGLIPAAAIPVFAQNVTGLMYASGVRSGEGVILMGDTTLNMDTDLTVPSIEGDYNLTIQGSGKLTVNGGGNGIAVKSLHCTSDLFVQPGWHAIDVTETVYIDNADSFIVGGIYAAGNIDIRSNNATIGGNDYAISSALGSITLSGGTFDIGANGVAVFAETGNINMTGAFTVNSNDGRTIDALKGAVTVEGSLKSTSGAKFDPEVHFINRDFFSIGAAGGFNFYGTTLEVTGLGGIVAGANASDTDISITADSVSIITERYYAMYGSYIYVDSDELWLENEGSEENENVTYNFGTIFGSKDITLHSESGGIVGEYAIYTGENLSLNGTFAIGADTDNKTWSAVLVYGRAEVTGNLRVITDDILCVYAEDGFSFNGSTLELEGHQGIAVQNGDVNIVAESTEIVASDYCAIRDEMANDSVCNVYIDSDYLWLQGNKDEVRNSGCVDVDGYVTIYSDEATIMGNYGIDAGGDITLDGNFVALGYLQEAIRSQSRVEARGKLSLATEGEYHCLTAEAFVFDGSTLVADGYAGIWGRVTEINADSVVITTKVGAALDGDEVYVIANYLWAENKATKVNSDWSGQHGISAESKLSLTVKNGTVIGYVDGLHVYDEANAHEHHYVYVDGSLTVVSKTGAGIYVPQGPANLYGGSIVSVGETHGVYADALTFEGGTLRIDGNTGVYAISGVELSGDDVNITAFGQRNSGIWVENGYVDLAGKVVINTNGWYGINADTHVAFEEGYYQIIGPKNDAQAVKAGGFLYLDGTLEIIQPDGGHVNGNNIYGAGDSPALNLEMYSAIRDVSLLIDGPRDGKLPDRNASDVYFLDPRCTVESIVWYEDGEEMVSQDALFRAGHRYTVKITLSADDPYRFVSGVMGKVNGKSVTTGILDGDKKGMILTADLGECAYAISAVELEITAPVEGKTPSTSVTDYGAAYGVYSRDVRWGVSTDGVNFTIMAAGEKFVGGKYYRVFMDVNLLDGLNGNGYKFPVTTADGTVQPDVVATVNGSPAVVEKAYDQDPEEVITVYFDFGKCNDYIIEEIAIIGVTAPVVGQHPNYDVNMFGTGYHVDTTKNSYYDAYWVGEKWYYVKNGVSWWDVTDGGYDYVYENDVFLPGHQYQCEVYVATDDGYEFVNDIYTGVWPTATINGNSATIKQEGSGLMWEQQVSYTFTCSAQQISSVRVNGLDEPQAGKHPDHDATVAVPEHYQLDTTFGTNGIQWYNCEQMELTPEDTFIVGEPYCIAIRLITADEGFRFTDDLEFYINDKVVTPYGYWDDVVVEGNTVTAYYTFRKAASAPTLGYTVSGTVTSFNDTTGDITLQLFDYNSDTVAYETTVKGNMVDYIFADVAAGVYTLRISKENHVTREYMVIVNSGSVVQDVKIHLKGDINGDGRVNVSDVGLANAHAKKVSTLEGYQFDCANVNGDARITISDVGLLNAHAKKTSLLW